jgi:hypothetical protein
MEFEIVFDLTREGFKLWAPQSIALVFLLGGALMALAPRLYALLLRVQLMRSPSRTTVQISGLAVSIIAAPVFTYLFFDSYRSYDELMNALNTGRYESVEGLVERAQAVARTRGERFEVKGIRFEYAPMDNAHGFKKPAADGGPIREGQYVRIAHIGREILRLEVRK